MIDIERLLTDFSISHATTGPNTSPGWINIRCPFCADSGMHLGISKSAFACHCWKCGGHPFNKTLAKLLRISEQEVSSIIRQYGGRVRTRTEEEPVKIGLEKFKYPSHTETLQKQHKRYLENRNFDPDKLEREWNLLATGPISTLSYLDRNKQKVTVDYKHRIIAPISYDGEVVTFQARDITDKHHLRYIACPHAREIRNHKTVIYGKQEEWKDWCIVTEGITDVWRLGSIAVATFGIEFTLQQVKEIKKHFKRAFVLFDCEEQAQAKAHELCSELQFRGVETVQLSVEDDPANLTDSEALALIRNL